MGKFRRLFLPALSAFCMLISLPAVAENAQLEFSGKSFSAFPILMYNSDIGIGYGAKAKFVNYLSKRESFDLMLFGSSKGERLIDFIFSKPDIEIRQRKKYALSLDFRARYNRLLTDNFCGIGPHSEVEDLTNFTYEIKELKVSFGRGFSSFFVSEVAYSFRNVRYYDVEENKPYTETLNSVGEQFSPFLSLLVRYDTSDSQINPLEGIRFEFQNDLAYGFLGNKNTSFARFVLDFRKYTRLFGKKDVLAFRVRVQSITGSKIPLFELSVLGGGSTENALRGYRMNRFQDKGKFLLNCEYRFPIWKRLGGNLFADCGTVWPSMARIDLTRPAIGGGLGLRYYLKNFVVRFDIGISREETRVYFQFNQIF
jgi:outer membrane protein assembly factor BamA